MYYPDYFRGKLCLFEATYLEGKDGYEPSLKLEQNMELVDAQKICGDAVEDIRLIQLACVQALKFAPMSITGAMALYDREGANIYAEARIKIVQLQSPFIALRCPKVFMSGPQEGKQCLCPVVGGKCRKIHLSSQVGDPIKKLSAWIAFLDADLLRSVQRRAYVRPNALAQITGIDEDDLIAMSAGVQETISKCLLGQIFVGRFIIAKAYITCGYSVVVIPAGRCNTM